MSGIKIIEDARYHIWTDALHLRELARDAKNKWDRGVYVRASVLMAWTTFETVAESLLEARIGYGFKRNLTEAIKGEGLEPLEWGRGIWQEMLDLNDRRADYLHRAISEGVDLFPEVKEAEKAVSTIREAVQALFEHASQQSPGWILDDKADSWSGEGSSHGAQFSGHLIVSNAEPEDPSTVRVTSSTRPESIQTPIDHQGRIRKS